MSRTIIARYVNPWKYRREQAAQRVHALRQRDGDDCRRCRRPLSFDLPAGHDAAPTVQPIADADDGVATIDHLCLCHRRCTAATGDSAPEIRERLRLKREAELFSKQRHKRRA